MHKFNIAQATDDELRSWLSASTTLIHAMRGNVLPYTVHQILDESIPDDIQRAYTVLNMNIAANGYFFDNDKQGFLGELMEDLYGKRKSVKKEMLVRDSEVEEIEKELRRRNIQF